MNRRNESDLWDKHWKEIIEDENKFSIAWNAVIVPSFDLITNYIPFLRERSYSDIFFPGVGISFEPMAFYHSGFNVICVDSSSVAIQFLSNYCVEEKHLSAFFPVYFEQKDERFGIIKCIDIEKSINRVKKEKIPGGHIRFINSNICEFIDDSVDVIISRRFVQTLENPEKTIHTYFSILRNGGIVFEETLNLIANKEYMLLEKKFQKAGFLIIHDLERCLTCTNRQFMENDCIKKEKEVFDHFIKLGGKLLVIRHNTG